LFPVCSQAAESKVITPVLSLLLGGGTCSSGVQTVVYAGKEWQRCDDGHTYSFDEANAYCANLSLGGHSDWRLPTKDELKSLVVCTNGTPTPLLDYDHENNANHPYYCGDGNSTPYNSPTIDSQFSCQPALYLSSSVLGQYDSWVVGFHNGGADWHLLARDDSYVRCVR
jgi:formylglycine-generating enzyme required for sulfatase activity